MSSPGQLYNAFIAVDTFVQDRLGRWVVQQIPGTGNASWNEPAYGIIRPVGADVWFNTSVKPDKPNTFEISVNRPDYVMTQCYINHPEELGSLKIPQDPRIKLFFWQLDRFLRHPSLGGRGLLLPGK